MRKPKIEFYNKQDYTIVYPVVIIKNLLVNKKINDKISKAFFDESEIGESIEKALDLEISTGLIYMSYKITFKKNGILSLDITAEGCGAYCSSWDTFFNFDLKTGELLTIEDLIKSDRLAIFKNIVFKDKTKALNNYKEEIKTGLERNEIDSNTYNWAIEEVKNYCINSVELDNFFLDFSKIEIVDKCEFPHAIRSQQPSYNLIYSYDFIKDFLKPEYIKQIIE